MYYRYFNYSALDAFKIRFQCIERFILIYVFCDKMLLPLTLINIIKCSSIFMDLARCNKLHMDAANYTCNKCLRYVFLILAHIDQHVP